MFPVITKEIQQKFEEQHMGQSLAELPMICGVYGRACRQMEKAEGANRALCTYCPLAAYAKTV